MPHTIRGDGADCRNCRTPHSAKVTGIGAHAIDEMIDAVGAGEDYPVERSDLSDRTIENLVTRGRRRLDRRELDRLTAECSDARGEFTGVMGGARDHDAPPKQRHRFEPVQLAA